MNETVFATHRRPWYHKAFLKRLLWSAAGSCALGGLCAWKFEDHWLRVEERPMPLRGLGRALHGARLAHISDLHCSPIVLAKYLRRCIETINALEVDFVAITGDFITGRKRHARRVARVLRHLRPRVATIACMGNHDYGIYHPRNKGGREGLAEYLAEELTRADVFVVRNESRTFRRGDDVIQFVGVEDFWSHRYDPYQAFALTRPEVPTIGLCHNPDAAWQMARCGAQWVLAGHTHGSGLPDAKLSDLVFPSANRTFVAGEYPLGPDRWLYVNRGLGYGRRINLNARPEITLFTLQSAGDKAAPPPAALATSARSA